MKVTNLIIAALIVGAMTSPVSVRAEIAYPVAELGNCADQASCKAYCDKPANIDTCLSFAEKNNLMSKDEIKKAKNFKKGGMTGPGGCKGKDECKTYCSNSDHMDECITFAEKNGMMSGEQLDEAKKVRGAISRGIKPPACGTKETCDTYCSSPEHVEECVKFGEDAGMINKENADKIRKAGGKGRGGEKGPEGQDDRQGPKEKGGGGKNNRGPGGQGGGGQGGDKQGQGNGKQRPPQGQRQGQGQDGQDKNQDQNQGGPTNDGQIPPTN